ncbi:hypothetical protein [Streptomyces sp. NBC_00582]|nr:hypothetical protein [Streptomyces sp. NBC_00582]WUB63528.1 hypothetical protein OG852_25620 [Streptomyces sp. NBC_00582]
MSFHKIAPVAKKKTEKKDCKPAAKKKAAAQPAPKRRPVAHQG